MERRTTLTETLVTFAHIRTRRKLQRSTLIVVASLAGLVTSGVASKGITQQVGPVNCTGGGQLCNVIAPISITLNAGGGPGVAEFISSSPFACSNVRIHFWVDNVEVAVTGFVGPGGNTGFVSIGSIGNGSHTIGVQAEGQAGGCNVGTLFSWAGTVRLQHQ
jgi:hypothetical protein